MPYPKLAKLGPKTQEMFIGYIEHSKAYRFLEIVGVNKDSIIESKDVIYFLVCLFI